MFFLPALTSKIQSGSAVMFLLNTICLTLFWLNLKDDHGMISFLAAFSIPNFLGNFGYCTV
ncbi:MAG: hypothetical protein CMI27_01635 [Opitutae bacterium]|nr:hypothetical protein [Opitutae bacterium]|tara:strand:+ start:269 stop:451 length:183 start_codon:yes stop_codon:yes gene_type:complete